MALKNTTLGNNKWWLNQYTLNQIEVIEAQQAVEQRALDMKQENFNKILEMYKNSFGDTSGSNISVPDAFKQNVDLFAKGGEYGAGLKAETAQAAQESIAAGQMGLASSGMSSGTNVAGLQARVLAEKGRSDAKIEDSRIANLSNALTSLGSANLSAQQLKNQRDLALFNTLASF